MATGYCPKQRADAIHGTNGGGWRPMSMQELQNAGRMHFRPHFDVHVLDEHHVALLAEGGNLMLQGKLYVLLVPFLQGGHTLSDILAALEGKAPAERVRLATGDLIEKKY